MPERIRAHMAQIPIQMDRQPLPGTLTQHISGLVLLGRFFTETVQFLIG